ncbi:hypothetical protein [Luteolibacter pohnpeiensis]|nr:hypothetical protein [Luteolibacter pohnpeiensis]
MQHSQSPVPNLFGGKEDKKDVGDGFYEQAGSVASNSLWEAVAHYTYLAYHGVEIGNASYPYSISPSGRFVIIPESYYHGAKSHKLKIYDKTLNRFVLREVEPQVISGYNWAADERMVTVFFESPLKSVPLKIPKP